MANLFPTSALLSNLAAIGFIVSQAICDQGYKDMICASLMAGIKGLELWEEHFVVIWEHLPQELERAQEQLKEQLKEQRRGKGPRGPVNGL